MNNQLIRAAIAALVLAVPASAFANAADVSVNTSPTVLAYASGAAKSDRARSGDERQAPRRAEDRAVREQGYVAPQTNSLSSWSGNQNEG